MYYLNSNSIIKIGDVVSVAQHCCSSQYLVRKIDAEQGMVYLTLLGDKSFGQWVSGYSLFLILN